MKNRVIAVGALAALVACSAVSAQGWPNRPIRLIVPFAAGGPSDVVGREVAARLQENLGQPVIVDIRAGANSTIGAKQTPSASAGKINLPSRARQRHSDRWFARSPYRAATAFTVTPGFRLSATIRALISSGQRRCPLVRMSTP